MKIKLIASVLALFSCIALVNCEEEESIKPPSITNLTPESGLEGALITIAGTHFSTTPAENLVTFNGVNAEVTTSTATQLTVTVPTGATTGKVEITVKGNTVTSATDFIVLHAPVINSFTPSTGLPATSTGFDGATITVTGNYFSTVPAGNTVKFNGTSATVVTATETQLTVQVPAGASTGKISVAVENREALSTNDFTVLPTNVWTSVNSTHDALLRTNGIAFVIGTKIYFGLGQNASNADMKDFWEYDTETEQFTRKKDFEGSERNGATAFAIGNKGYVCTGFHTGTPYQDLWEYDPAMDDWTERATFPGAKRSGATSFSVGSKGYVGTGYASLTYFADLYEFDPAGGANGSGSWTQKADVGIGVAGRQAAARFVINEKGYIGGGYANGNRRDFWGFAADQWSATAEPNVPTFVITTFSFGIGTKGFVKIGSDLWMYDPSTNEWAKKTTPPAINGIGVNVGNAGYVIGGSTAAKHFYKYVPN
jgi:N-acetylneuraminic acid mutarotase